MYVWYSPGNGLPMDRLWRIEVMLHPLDLVVQIRNVINDEWLVLQYKLAS
jgi:hypothetical protein